MTSAGQSSSSRFCKRRRADPFKWLVDLAINTADQNRQFSEHGESSFGSIPLFSRIPGGLGEGSIRREEADARGMRFENFSNTLAQNCANQYVRVENHHFRCGPFDDYGVLPRNRSPVRLQWLRWPREPRRVLPRLSVVPPHARHPCLGEQGCNIPPSMASNGDWPGCLQERCHPLPKLPNPDFLCLHVNVALLCTHDNTKGREGAPSLTSARTKRGLSSPIPAGLRRPATPRFGEPLRGCLA